MKVADMSVDAVVAALEARSVTSEDLDDIVHEGAGEVASKVNNAGLCSQVAWLFEQGFADELDSMIPAEARQ